MQPIERVGVFALLFLVVTVVAVVLWDKSPDERSAGAASAEAKASPRQARDPKARDPKERVPGQLEDPIARDKSLAKSLSGPRDPLPTASVRDEALPPATRSNLYESESGGDALGADTAAATPDGGLLAKRELAKRDMGPDAQASSRATSAPATAPTTVVVPRVAERSPNAVHVVKAGETLSDIATTRLGQASRWKEIADLNGVDPAKLHVGAELRLPAGAGSKTDEAAKTAAPKVASTSTYRVVSGDSMWRIAERELGDGERWKEIASLNPGIDANRLVAGATLTLPLVRRAASAVPAKSPATAAKPATTVASAGSAKSTASAKKKGTVR